MFGLAPWRRRRDTAIRENIEELFDTYFRDYATGVPFPGPDWAPNLDLSQTKDAVLVRAELPGLEPNDIEISLHGNELTIRGVKRCDTEDLTEDYHCRECFSGAFIRHIRLPCNVNADLVNAFYRKGVLKIVLPKLQHDPAERITIHVR